MALRLRYEVLVVDNNPLARLSPQIAAEFPDVQFLVAPRHLGFGGAQNYAFRHACGRHVLSFNPDIFPSYGSLESLVQFLDAHEDVGIVGAWLQNPDGSLQHSCYRFDGLSIKILRRTPLRRHPWVAKKIDRFMMVDSSHHHTMDVDWMMGSCLCVRRSLFERLGGFDERFVMYFEDADLCRRAWKAGMRVVYHPAARMVHYHRREGSDGFVLWQLFRRTNRLHIQSWVKYLRKYGKEPHPRLFA